MHNNHIKNHLVTLRELFLMHGFKTVDLEPLATITYLTGGFDGVIKSDVMVPSDFLDDYYALSQFKEMLKRNLYTKFVSVLDAELIPENDSLIAIKPRLMHAFSQLGFLAPAEQEKDKDSCSFAIVFGDLQTAMTQAIRVLLSQKIIRKHICFLVTDRPLCIDTEPACVDLLYDEISLKAIDRDCQETLTSKMVRREAEEFWRACSKDLSIDQKRISVRQSFEHKYGVAWPTEYDLAAFLVANISQTQDLPLIEYLDVSGVTPMICPDYLQAFTAYQCRYEHQWTIGSKIVAVSCYPNIKLQAQSMRSLPSYVHTEMIGYDAIGQLHKPLETLLVNFSHYCQRCKPAKQEELSQSKRDDVVFTNVIDTLFVEQSTACVDSNGLEDLSDHSVWGSDSDFDDLLEHIDALLLESDDEEDISHQQSKKSKKI